MPANGVAVSYSAPPVYHYARQWTGGEPLRRFPNQMGGGGVELMRGKLLAAGGSAPLRELTLVFAFSVTRWWGVANVHA
jgi:hypothetical protein